MVSDKKKFNIAVLIAPLDWGLGHSTRCIPIISHLVHLGCKVLIGSEGPQAALLSAEFPNITILPLRGYRIDYSNRKRLFAAKIVLQLPKIWRTIRAEKQWLRQAVATHNIDLVISDNRFGLYHASIPAIFITHQLWIKSPVKLAESIIKKLNYYFIQKFAECWIPDEPGAPNMAGTLSHAKKMPKIPVTYLGGISRLNNEETAAKKYAILIVISGPEPQRTLLEKRLLQDLSTYHEPVLMVRGLPGSAEVMSSFNQVTILNHLPARDMETAFLQSEIIVSRSGYTTIMDLLKLQKKSILIPTPGQTEQEYLARHLHAQNWCLHLDQRDFDLQKALERARHFNYQMPTLKMERYKTVIEEFIAQMRPSKSSF